MAISNIHIYPSPITNESRINKVTKSIKDLNIFTEIYIIGLWQPGLPEIERVDEVRVIRRIRPFFGTLGKNKFIKTLSIIEWSFRIIFFTINKGIKCVNARTLSVLPICVFLKLINGANLVYDPHELETEKLGWHGFAQRLAKLTEKLLIFFVDKIVVVSPSIAEWYKVAYKKEPFIIINAPYYKITSRKNIFREKYDIPESSIIFIYQGGLSEGRGIEFLLEVFKNVKRRDIALIFMGYGPLVNEILALSKESYNIYYHPSVKPEEVLEYVSSADVGFSLLADDCLNHSYCLPNKLFECLMAGIPIISTQLTEIKKIIDKYKVGYLLDIKNNRLNSDTLFQILNTINKNEIESLRRNIEKAKTIFTWENQEEIIKSIYCEIH